MADIVTSRTFVDGEKNITAQKLNDIVASSVIQPAFVSAKPPASTVAPTDNLLVLTAAGGTYAKAPFQTVIDSVNANLNTNAAIWSVRLRSFQALGNNTFEVDQVNVGNAVTVTNAKAIDRWQVAKAGTMAATAQQVPITGGVNVPGTNFAITRSFLRINLTTAEPSLAAGDYLVVQQNVEGPRWRELQNDVHSIQVLVRSSVAGLSFGIGLHDPSSAHSLTNLLTIPTANTWVLLTLPNLPLWPAGTFVNTPGNVGYTLVVCLGAGSTFTSPANSTWQNGNFFGATGQSNFANSPVNSTFDLAYISQEPGPLCSTPMDCPFTQNLDDCLRYYQKSYEYAAAVGSTGNVNGMRVYWNLTTTSAFPIGEKFRKTMAKTPTLILYNHSTGAANSMVDGVLGTAAVSSVTGTSTESMGYTITAASGLTANNRSYSHYTADTGW